MRKWKLSKMFAGKKQVLLDVPGHDGLKKVRVDYGEILEGDHWSAAAGFVVEVFEKPVEKPVEKTVKQPVEQIDDVAKIVRDDASNATVVTQAPVVEPVKPAPIVETVSGQTPTEQPDASTVPADGEKPVPAPAPALRVRVNGK